MNSTTDALLLIAVILVAIAIYNLYSYLKERRYKKFPTLRR
ncbi:small membrane protein [Tatumella sp. UBA2305]|nr:small membrane protein [Tatumella sp. UBA2305]